VPRLGEQFAQIERITFSWMDATRALETIQQIVHGECESVIAQILNLRLEWPELHGRCHHCD